MAHWLIVDFELIYDVIHRWRCAVVEPDLYLLLLAPVRPKANRPAAPLLSFFQPLARTATAHNVAHTTISLAAAAASGAAEPQRAREFATRSEA